MALHPGLLNQVFVDSIRAINFTMFRQAVEPKRFAYAVEGRVGYVFDPQVVASDDANGSGFFDPEAVPAVKQRSYRVSRMRFFADLVPYLRGGSLARVRAPRIASGAVNLARFDSLILANDAMPEPANAARYFAALERWVRRGGNLVVTDAAVSALVSMGLLEAADVTVETGYVGSVEEFVDRSHPLNAGLRGVASQTYDTVPIGYAFGPEGNQAPNWKVNQSAWEAAGGYTAGTNGEGKTIYGELPVGRGTVRFLGALLPDPTEAFYHPYGLQSYAVTYTGYTLLQNMLNAD
jgi:hypothetical protein